ncbi:MAG: hypothetical protein WCA51_04505 [Dehalococcoidia bacterium]
MKTRNKAVFVLWQGIALVAILVSILFVGFGASIAYAGGGGAGGSGGSAGGSGGGAGGSGGSAAGSGGSAAGSGAVVGTGNCFSAEWDGATALLMPVAAGSTNTFVLIVTNLSAADKYVNSHNNTSSIDLEDVTVSVPVGFTYAGNLSAVSTNYYWYDHNTNPVVHEWRSGPHNWNVNDAGAPLLHAWTTDPNAKLEVNAHHSSPWSYQYDYLAITFKATAPDWCYPGGGKQFKDFEFTTSASYWGKTGSYQDPPIWHDKYKDQCGKWHDGYWEPGQWHDTYGLIADELDCGKTQPVVPVEAPPCPVPTPTPPPPPPQVLTPGLLPLVTGEETATFTPVLVVDMLGTTVRYPVTNNGNLLVDAMTTSPDGLVTLFIPAGTQVLNSDGTPAYLNKDPDLFSITAATPTAPAGYTMVAAYEFLPSGIIFSPDATLIMKYNAEKIPANGAPVIAYYDQTAGQWINLETAGYVAAGVAVPNTLQAHTAHLTYFAILAK